MNMNTQPNNKLGPIREAARRFGWWKLANNNCARQHCRPSLQPPEPLEPRIVYSGTVPVLKFTEEDGDSITIKLTGLGSFTATQLDPDANDKGSLSLLALSGTDLKSKLTLTFQAATGGDGQFHIGSITADSPLGAITGASTALDGAGLTVAGNLGAVTLGSVSAPITVAGSLGNLTVNGDASGNWQAVKFGKVQISGGDLSADIRSTAPLGSDFAIGSINVTGGNFLGDVIALGKLGTISAKSGRDGGGVISAGVIEGAALADLSASGGITDVLRISGAVGKIAAGRGISGIFRAGSFGAISAGDDFYATITSTDSLVALGKKPAIGMMTIAGDMTGELHAVGALAGLTVKATRANAGAISGVTIEVGALGKLTAASSINGTVTVDGALVSVKAGGALSGEWEVGSVGTIATGGTMSGEFLSHGGIGQLTIKGDVTADFTGVALKGLKATGAVLADLAFTGAVGAVDAGGNVGGTWSAAEFGKLGGRGAFSADLTATAAAAALGKRAAITSITAGGAMSGDVSAFGNVGNISAGGSASGDWNASTFGKLSAGGDFTARVQADAAAGNKPVIASVTVTGGVLRAGIFTNGDLGKVSVLFNKAGAGGNVASSTILARNIASFSASGDVTSSLVLAGANFGADFALGGSGANADTFGSGVVKAISIGDQLASTTIGSGLLTQNSILGDGDDSPGSAANVVKSVAVRGGISADSVLAAGTFPAKVQVGTEKLAPKDDVRFLTIGGLDNRAPLVNAGLLNDSGRSATDGLTNDASSRILAQDGIGLGTVRVSLDAQTTFVQVSGAFTNAQFNVTGAQLNTLFGTVADGAHTLHVQVADAAGNVAPTVDILFTLDTAAPTAPVFELATTSDTGTAGDGTTSSVRVTIVGSAEPLSDIELVGAAGVAATTNGSGRFTLPNVNLAAGLNTLRLRIADEAGNSAEGIGNFTRDAFAAGDDPVLAWNHEALEAIRRDASAPPLASRNLAMVHTAILDAVNALDGISGFYVNATAAAGASAPAAVAAAAYNVLVDLYPAQQVALDVAYQAALTQAGAPGAERDAGVAVGAQVAAAILAQRLHDGSRDFATAPAGTDPGEWRPTGPGFAPGLLPQWATLDPFVMSTASEFRPAAPPTLGSAQYATEYNEVKALGSATGSTRTADQTQIARFWADGGGSYTPPGHWNDIASDVARSAGNSLSANARLFATLNSALADAAIVAWDAKYLYNFWRPVTAIQNGEDDGNAATVGAANWTSMLATPPFPEYVSGHSTFSGAADAVLTAFFGNTTSFTTDSLTLPGANRTFANFTAAANEAGQSRIYGGIHFQSANQAGLAAGRALGAFVTEVFSGVDTQAPRIQGYGVQQGQAVAGNFTLQGYVTDSVSGVETLTVKTDAGSEVTVAFDPVSGAFSVPTSFVLDGSADGAHSLRLTATDHLGHASQITVTFTLDTVDPATTLTAPLAGATLAVGQHLTGSVNGTGSAITAFSYHFDNGQPAPVLLDQSGNFDTPLRFGHLAVGAHTLTISARDAAGHTSTSTVNITVPAGLPVTINDYSPSEGADQIGSTFRPKITFSRPIDTSTLSSANFHVDAGGQTIPGTIVPASDGTFAWFFPTNPMPSSSVVSVTVDGETITAADGTKLDADGDGTQGGVLNFTFSTVNLAFTPGTTITGILVDPGADLDPHTFDDFRLGPDNAAFTADDIFLHPIAGARLYIIGHEDQAIITGADGKFTIPNVPAGDVKLVIDGLPSTNAPSGFYFPEMVMDVQVAAGRDNWVMEEMHEVYLPRLRSQILNNLTGTAPMTFGVGAEDAADLTNEQRNALTITVTPGTLIGPDGQPIVGGQIGISTVPAELVRDMLPPGLLEHTFDITVQAPGAATFSRPAEMTFPNVFNAAPGTKLNFLSFDHTTGQLVIEGTATVSADGKTVTTDPDTGITHPGWHGLTPPGTPMPDPNPDPKPDDPVCPPLGWGDAWNIGKSVYDCIRDLSKVLQVIGTLIDVIDSFSTLIQSAQDLAKDIQDGKTMGAIKNGYAIIKSQKEKYVSIYEVATAQNPVNKVLDIAQCAAGIINSINDALCERKDCLGSAGKWICDYVKPVTDFIDSALDKAEDLADGIRNAPMAAVCLAMDGLESAIEIAANAEANQPKAHQIGGANPRADVETHISEVVAQLTAFNTDIGPAANVGDSLEDIQGNFSTVAHDGLGKMFTEVRGFRNAFVKVTVGDNVFYSRTTAAGAFTLPFVQAETPYKVEVYNPTHNILAVSTGISAPSGQQTRIAPFITESLSDATDTDGDALPDRGEAVIGTSPTRVDTDRDGLTDPIEIRQGLDPLNGLSLPVGVVGVSPLLGEAKEVAVIGSTVSSDGTIALVATGTHGLAIVNATRPDQPVVLSQLDLPGDNVDVAVDAVRNLAVLAAGAAGLHIVNIADQNAPSLVSTIDLDHGAQRVEVYDGVAYVASGSSIISFDLATGERIQTLPLSGTVSDIAREGSFLYALQNGGTIQVVSLADLQMTVKGSTSGAGSGKIFAGGGVLYVPIGAGFSGGYSTFDVSNPDSPSLISGVDLNSIGNAAFAANGSGLGLVVGVPGNLGNVVDVVNTSVPGNTGTFITRFTVPAAPQDVAIGAGIGFIADGTAGLQIVNYRAFDSAGIAPTVSITSPIVDADLATPGVQVIEGRSLPINLLLNDDVQVRNVELIVNGAVVSNSASFPHDFVALAPALAAGASTLTVQVRATDTGGNSTLSNILTFPLIADTIAPLITGHTPATGQRVFTVPAVDVRFDERVDSASVDLAKATITFLGADGAPGTGDESTISLASFEVRQLGRRVQFYPTTALGEGAYSFHLDAGAVKDIAGNALAAPLDFQFSVRPPSTIRALTGTPAITRAPSANPGQEIELSIPGADSNTLLIVPVMSYGTLTTQTIYPAAADPVNGRAFYVIPENAVTGDLHLTHNAVTDFVNFGLWNVTAGDVNLYTRSGSDLMVNFNSYGSGNRLETKDAFLLQPGTYELTFDLKGADYYSNDSVRVQVGTLLDEVVPVTTGAAFTTITRTITVTSATSAKVAFGTTPDDYYEPSIDNVRLQQTGATDPVFADNFNFDFVDGAIPLQIVPVVSGIDVQSWNAQNATITLTGQGFIEAGTEYHFGSVKVVDSDPNSGPDVYYYNNTSSYLNVPVNGLDWHGAITLTTAGGTSAPFTLGTLGLQSVALQGTPANAVKASANPGQTATIVGTGLSTGLDLMVTYTDDAGTTQRTLVRPTFVSADATTAQFTVPSYFNGITRVETLGSSSRPELQIVPTISNAIVNGQRSVVLYGTGFAENATYDLGGTSLVDPAGNSGPDVYYSGTQLNLTTPLHGNGAWTITTAGGTSAPFAMGVAHPNLNVALYGLAVDPDGSVWTSTTNNIQHINPTTGAVLGSFANPGGYNYLAGMEIVGAGLTLNGTAVPSGSLLFLNGYQNADRIYALNPATGATIAALTLAENFDAVGMHWSQATGKLFVIDGPLDELVELNPANGSVLGRVTLPVALDYGGITEDAAGHLRIASSTAGALLEYNAAGTTLIGGTFLPRNSGTITGIAFDAAGNLHTATDRGVIQRVEISADPTVVPTPTVSAIQGIALGGTAASAGASANAGQAITLTGTNFGVDTRVIFQTTESDGRATTLVVSPTVTNADGTRLEVIVPDYASTGGLRVFNVPTTNFGFSSYYADEAIRGVTARFTAGGASTALRFEDLGLEGIGNESWGVDNVRITRVSDGATVYSNNFESTVGAEWNSTTTDATLRHIFSTFLGRFSDGGSTLTVPTANGVEYDVTFDFYAFDSWDGGYTGAGPDRFALKVDGVQKALLSPSHIDSTSYQPTTGLSAPSQLQIVPTLTGYYDTNRPGSQNTFGLRGSGIIEGGTTIQIGGITLTNNTTANYDGYVGQNDYLYNLRMPFGVEGDITITTAGGSFTLRAPGASPTQLAILSGITTRAELGEAANLAAASANPGQDIVITGEGFRNGTVVEFSAVDSTGAIGLLHRTGTVSADGTRLTVEVPLGAKTGPVKIIGAPGTGINLQVVPVLNSHGGNLTAGQTIVLDGAGFIPGETTVTIGGQAATITELRSIFDTNSQMDQQVAFVTVPAGAVGSTIQLSTLGGLSRIQPVAAIANAGELTPPADPADILAAALEFNVAPDSTRAARAQVGDGGFPLRDVDLYRVNFSAGDRLDVAVDVIAGGSVGVRLFNSSGTNLTGGFAYSNDASVFDNFIIPAAGDYFIGISHGNNNNYDPKAANSGVDAGTADYRLHVTRDGYAHTSITGITGTATSGTPTVATIASANAGQRITVHGSGFAAGDTVYFRAEYYYGYQPYFHSVAIENVAVDGTSFEVVVPTDAASGSLQMSDERVGAFLQIVPKITTISTTGSFHSGGSLTLGGSGFVAGNTDIHYGGLTLNGTLAGVSSSYYGTTLNTSVHPNAPAGPITVTTLGGTSAAFASTFTGIVAAATSGTAANGAVASANPGQLIQLNGTGFTTATNVLFPAFDDEGRRYEIVAQPSRIDANGTSLWVQVPNAAGTGDLAIVGDTTNAALRLQIVPVLTSINTSSWNGASASVYLYGSGIIENGATYHFGSVSIEDTLRNEVNSYYGGTQAYLTIPTVGAGWHGAVTVTTEGGTSAPFVQNITTIQSLALQGTPANGSVASANPGQTVSITGSGLSTDTDLLLRYTDDAGNPQGTIIRPTFTSVDGTTAQFILPDYMNGLTSVELIGSANAPQLQIVPVLQSGRIDSEGHTVLTGHGFIENAAYTFAGQIVTDSAANSGPDVYYSGTQASVTLPAHGLGAWTVTTAGGTSAPLAMNVTHGDYNAALYDVAVDGAGAIWTSTTNDLKKIDPATGATLASFPMPGGYSYLTGLQIVGAGLTLGATAIPAGSLLVLNGYQNSDGIYALNPATGATLAQITLAQNLDGVGVHWSTASGKLFVLDGSPDELVEINPATGASLVHQAIGFDVNIGGIAEDTAGNLWVASDIASQLVKFNAAGDTILSRLDLRLLGVEANTMTGVVFDAAGQALISSQRGVIHRVNLGADSVAAVVPTLSTINAMAIGGTAANGAQASANVAQTITLTGTGFNGSTRVIFPTINDAGVVGTITVEPTAWSANGTTLQVMVPDYATTGDVKVFSLTQRDLGFSGYNDSVYRDVTVRFTATGTSTALRFEDLGLQSLSDESWGLDNVSVSRVSDSSQIYASDFESGAGTEWSTRITDNSQLYSLTKFLGRFSGGGTNLSLTTVAGTEYELQFDFLAIDSWDGTAVSTGGDRFRVTVNGQERFNEAFDNYPNSAAAQTYATSGARLQVVPTITGYYDNNRPGSPNAFGLRGSGFVEGGTTILVGTQTFSDSSVSYYDGNVSGSRNGTFTGAYLDFAVDSAVTVTTAGGSFTMAAQPPTSAAFSVLTGITTTAGQGIAASGSLASANPGQTITLRGHGLRYDTVVEFTAEDTGGGVGVVHRTGSASSDGTTLTVTVPLVAKTGIVKVIGDSGAGAQLQVVPLLKGYGGTLTPGGTIILDGAGFIHGETTVTVGGQIATVGAIRALHEENGIVREIAELTLPGNLGNGVLEVSTPGGVSRIQAAATLAAVAEIVTASDPGDTLATALTVALSPDTRQPIRASIGDGANTTKDVDYYKVALLGGDTLSLRFDRISGDYSTLWVFDADGTVLTQNTYSGPSSTPQILNFHIPATGNYFVAVSGDGNYGFDPDIAGSGNADGSSSYRVYMERSSYAGSSITGITTVATSGTASRAAIASANTEQTITITGTGIVATDTFVFMVENYNGDWYEQTVTPTNIAALGTSAEVVVPANAVSGTVRLSRESVGAYLQIVPVLTGFDTPSQFHDSSFALHGSGFSEGDTTVHYGNQSVPDLGRNGGHNVYYSGTYMYALVPPGAPFGPFSVTTVGGTSAPIGGTLTTLSAVATSGTPANPAAASANAGQTITISGVGFNANTRVFLQLADYYSNDYEGAVTPDSVAVDGTSLTLTLPANVRTGTVGILGAANTPLLQIVPTVTAVDVDSLGHAVVTGSGFLEDHGSIYRFGGSTLIDTAGDYVVDVYSNSANDRVNIVMPAHSGGMFTVRTAGGESTPFALNFTYAGIGTVQEFAKDMTSGAIYLLGDNAIYQLDATTDERINAFPTPATVGSYSGLQVLASAATLAGVSVPSGSLLLFDGNAYFDRVHALNPNTGTVLATLNLSGNHDLVSGVFSSTSNSLFILKGSPDEITEINATSGAAIRTLALSFDVYLGGLAIHPTSGNLWVGSDRGTSIYEVNPASGAVLRTLDLATNGLAQYELTGFAFSDATTLRVASTRGVIYSISIV